MAIKVIWTDIAISQLTDVYDYYKNIASKSIAKKIVKSLVEASIQLASSPYIGSIEFLLRDRKYEYRFLVKKNYKIIYRYTDKTVIIVAVFDCRQNPVKISEIKDQE